MRLPATTAPVPAVDLPDLLPDSFRADSEPASKQWDRVDEGVPESERSDDEATEVQDPDAVSDAAEHSEDAEDAADSSPVPWSLPDAIAASAASLEAPELPAANLREFGVVADDVVGDDVEEPSAQSADEALELDSADDSDSVDESYDEGAEAVRLADSDDTEPEDPTEPPVHPDSEADDPEIAEALSGSGDVELAESAPDSESDRALGSDPELASEPESDGAPAFEGDPEPGRGPELASDGEARPTGAGIAAATGLFGSIGLGWAAKKASAAASVESDAADEGDAVQGDAGQGDTDQTGAEGGHAASEPETLEPWIAPALGVELAEGGNGLVFLLDAGRLPPIANLALVPTRPLRQRAASRVGVQGSGSSSDLPVEEALLSPSSPVGSDDPIAGDEPALDSSDDSGAASIAVGPVALAGAAAATAGTATLANLYRDQGHAEDAVRVMSSVRQGSDPLVDGV